VTDDNDDWMRYWTSPDSSKADGGSQGEARRTSDDSESRSGSSSRARSGGSRSSSGSRSKRRRSSRSRRKARRTRRIVGWSVAGVLVLIIAGVAWVGIRGWMAKSELEAAIPLANQVKTKILAADTDGASADAASLASHAAAAASLTGDPIWGAAELVPFVGPNLSAVGEAASVIDLIAKDAIVPMTADVASIGVSGFQPVNGAVDLAPLIAAQPTVAKASETFHVAAQRVSSIDADSTLEPVRSAVAQLDSAVGEADSLLDGVNRAITLAPKMLGADGDRNYLLLFQNPAELRAGGGITSALALLRTSGGAVSLVQQASGSDFATFNPPAVELPEETRGLYSDRPASYVQNTTLVPQFDLSGQIASKMWTDTYGGTVDGVMSFDPVALSYLLKATGPVELPSGDTLTSDNAVSFLLSEVYSKYPEPAIQDAVFASAAKAVFERVSSGGIDAKALLEALSRAAGEGRFSIWNANPDDQAVLADTTLAGGLPALTQDATGLGVYFNDATGGKMDYYLDTAVSTASELCRADGRPAFQVTVTLTNTAPADAASSLPRYVTGAGAFGVSPGNISTIVYVYGPQSVGALTDATIVTKLDSGSADAPGHASFDSDRTVAVFPVELAPGESRTMTVEYLGQAGNPLQIDTHITPTIKPSVYSTEINTGFSGCEVR